MDNNDDNERESLPPDSLFDGIEDVPDDERERDHTDLSTLLRVEDRPRGILSQTDREFLVGLKDYKHDQSEANRRQDIRERVAHGLRDFLLLWWLIDEQELAKITADLHEKQTLNDSFAAVISFIYRGLDRDETRLEGLVEEGVYAADNVDKSGRWAGDTESVEVTIDIERNPNLNEIYNRFKGEGAAQLTPTEIGILIRAGKISPDELEELRERRLRLPGEYFDSGLGSVLDYESDEDKNEPEG